MSQSRPPGVGPCAEGRAEHILSAIRYGVAVLDRDLRVVFANPAFAARCDGDPDGRPLAEALPGLEVLTADPAPLQTALAGKAATALVRLDQTYLDLQITPCDDAECADAHGPGRLIVMARDVTGEVARQQKLDALYLAGGDLAALDPGAVADLDRESRVELLKQNLRRYVRELLHYDVIEVRALRPGGELVPLVAEGMTDEARSRRLFAGEEGNGVTGWVAATGRSHVCPDTSCDPLYLPGADAARSSLTVPLRSGEDVVGTLNVESPRANAFDAADMQFAELFAREVASALLTLDLLTAQDTHTATRSFEAINRELALPADEVLSAAGDLLSRFEDGPVAVRDGLNHIISQARRIKQGLSEAGANLAPAAPRRTDRGNDTGRLRGMRVLVIDRDERTRQSAHALLDRYGCQVETAAAGHQGLALARTAEYDAVLADIRLPDMGGLEVYRRLREVQPNGRVVLMTVFGYDAGHAIVRARQEGLRSVLFKPFRFELLLDALLTPLPSSAGSV